MKRVILESPYNGAVDRHKAYARLAGYDCIRRGESPYASHLIITQFLDDKNADERKLGIEAGFVWREVADYTVFYCDFGFSAGMTEGLRHVKANGLKYQFRSFWLKADQLIVPEV